MTKARFRTKPGRLEAGISPRDGAVLNAGGNRTDSFTYDYDNDGGAIDNYTFNRVLPSGAIIKSITVDIQTAVAGATDVIVKAGSTSLTASTDLAALSGIASIALTDTDGIKLSSDSQATITIATAAATAGKVRFYINYYLPND